MKRITGIVMTTVILSTCVAFAQEIAVDVDVGDHGTVNGKEADHQETTDAEGTYRAVISPDEGYEIREIKVNGEPLSEVDQKNITENNGTLKLEGVTEKVDVSATFQKEGTAAAEAEKTDESKAAADLKEMAESSREETDAGTDDAKATADADGSTETETAAVTDSKKEKDKKSSKQASPATGDPSRSGIPAAALLAALAAAVMLLLRIRHSKRAGVRR